MVDRINEGWQRYNPTFEPNRATLMRENPLYKAKSFRGGLHAKDPEISAVGKNSIHDTPSAPKDLSLWAKFKLKAQIFFSSPSSISARMINYTQKRQFFSFVKSQRAEDLQSTRKGFQVNSSKLTVIESAEALASLAENLQGIKHANEMVEVAFEGLPTLHLPQQFQKDFPRMNAFSVGENTFKIAYQNGKDRHSTMVEADETMLQYLDNNKTLQTNVQNLMTQSMLVEPTAYVSEHGKYIANGSNFPQHFSIQVKDNNLHITIIKGFKLYHPDNIEQIVGYRAVKREIVIPKDALKEEIPQKSLASEAKTADELISGAKVIDTYTPVLKFKNSPSETTVTHALYAQLGFHPTSATT
ncbi:hypothetical protein [Parachlamydia sp. AcF125]|uniref:hypothetical protein n=1 Tax=Parachlamydia sp. AcF125 TaxID=2795736 RepID=UPI001BC9F96A|nr:hypothetical protein [Parachlamydia sp. AcF125]MBS4168532.1 hypothetical protein [Parachlamydia sp. AcF125]